MMVIMTASCHHAIAMMLSSIGSSFDDGDCDGVPTGDDCDDEDPEVRSWRRTRL